MTRLFFIFMIALLMPLQMQAAEVDPGGTASETASPFHVTKLPLPRFASLRKDKTYVRTGPGPQYPVKWEFKKIGLPVEIILEYEGWRKIRDVNGSVGWAHQKLLSGHRTAIVKSAADVELYKRMDAASGAVAKLEPKTIVNLQQCRDAWCRVGAGGYGGWVEKKNLWGVYENEVLN